MVKVVKAGKHGVYTDLVLSCSDLHLDRLAF